MDGKLCISEVWLNGFLMSNVWYDNLLMAFRVGKWHVIYAYILCYIYTYNMYIYISILHIFICIYYILYVCANIYTQQINKDIYMYTFLLKNNFAIFWALKDYIPWENDSV